MAKGTGKGKGKGNKRIAVIVTERHGEAMRMAVGLTLADDSVSVFLLGSSLPEGEDVALNLESLELMGADLYTDTKGNPGTLMSVDEAALALEGYDIVVSY